MKLYKLPHLQPKFSFTSTNFHTIFEVLKMNLSFYGIPSNLGWCKPILILLMHLRHCPLYYSSIYASVPHFLPFLWSTKRRRLLVRNEFVQPPDEPHCSPTGQIKKRSAQCEAQSLKIQSVPFLFTRRDYETWLKKLNAWNIPVSAKSFCFFYASFETQEPSHKILKGENRLILQSSLYSRDIHSPSFLKIESKGPFLRFINN